MKKTALWTLVLFTPLLWNTTAHALFGVPDLAALAQRVTIIANQGIQIAHSVTQISKITEQMQEIKGQYEHLKEQSLGQVGALTEPFWTLPRCQVRSSLTGSTGATTLPAPIPPALLMRLNNSAPPARPLPITGATA